MDAGPQWSGHGPGNGRTQRRGASKRTPREPSRDPSLQQPTYRSINPNRPHGERRYCHGFRPAASQQPHGGDEQSPSPTRKHFAEFLLDAPVETSRCRSRRKNYAAPSGPVSRLGLPVRAAFPGASRKKEPRSSFHLTSAAMSVVGSLPSFLARSPMSAYPLTAAE
jgi:hypothetical protein